jgi:hypothetical protein
MWPYPGRRHVPIARPCSHQVAIRLSARTANLAAVDTNVAVALQDIPRAGASGGARSRCVNLKDIGFYGRRGRNCRPKRPMPPSTLGRSDGPGRRAQMGVMPHPPERPRACLGPKDYVLSMRWVQPSDQDRSAQANTDRAGAAESRCVRRNREKSALRPERAAIAAWPQLGRAGSPAASAVRCACGA